MKSNDQLPLLRDELALLAGPVLPDGQPSWTLHDPTRNLFFQLDWPSVEILRRWHLRNPQTIADNITATTTLRMDLLEVMTMLGFLQQNQLVAVAPGVAMQMAEQLRQRRGSLAKRLLHNYLFFRIPLVKPDYWLGILEQRLGFFFSRLFLYLTWFAGITGLIGVYRSWEQYSATLVHMFTWEGLVAYGAALVGVKILHELGHGLTAKRFGCRVPTMGVAFLVLWPVAYTDTNEVWKLTRRDQRLKVAAAGILVELTIAVWATLAWVLLPEGPGKSAAFLLSSTTWISTLLVNASPFMRFDGYFLLMDSLQLPNLHARAFALARWDMRERLFALREPAPEIFPAWKTKALILFAWLTWMYRLSLFIGIAVMVYHFFIKVVGIFLFAVEMIWFVAMPLITELKAWQARSARIRRSRRAFASTFIVLLLIGLTLLPWPTRIHTSGLLQPRAQWIIYAPEQAQIVNLPHANGTVVKAGMTLMRLRSPAIETRFVQNEVRRQQLSWQTAASGLNPDLRRDWQLAHEELSTALAEQKIIAADAARYEPKAPYEGVLRDIDPDLREGDWVKNREVLGRVISTGPRWVVTYIDDADIHRVKIDDHALFTSDSTEGPSTRLRVKSIDKDASRTIVEPELTTSFGGHVLVREKGGVFYAERAVYRVLLEVESTDISNQHSWRGHVSIASVWEVPSARVMRSALSVLTREIGF